MIKIFIVEDEEMAKTALVQMLELISLDNELVGTAGSVDACVEQITQLKPDLVLLDIEIEGGTGFDVIQRLEGFVGKYVFTTAYSQYAVDAFKYSALDYLLKPIHSEELISAIEKTIDLISFERNYQELAQVFKDNEANINKKLVLKTFGVEHVVFEKDIVRIEADAAYCTFIMQDSKITVSKNLKYYASFLDDHQFVRCHQSHLVNINYVSKVLKGDFLELLNGDQIPISFRKKAIILEKIRNL